MKSSPTRDEVIELVKGYLIEVIEDLAEQDIDLHRSIADSGANSLELVEVISCSMRDLRVSIPRAELVLMETLDDVVEALYQAARAQAEPGA